MELSWFTRLKVAAAMAVGALVIGIFCRPFLTTAEPGSIAEFANLDIAEAGWLFFAALLSGFFAYFVSWPYGEKIGPLAAPAGLAVWAILDGTLAEVFQLNSAIQQRLEIFQKLRWEAFFWLAVVLAGFAGVYLASIICGKSSIKEDFVKLKKSILNINSATAVLASAFIAACIILQLARDTRIYDQKLGLISAQPNIPQTAFALIIGFGAAAFAVKKFLNASYFWTILSAPVITAFYSITFSNQKTIDYITAQWPAMFFANSIVCILPIQMVSFGTLGAIAGYWFAIKFEYWRQHQDE